MQAVAPNRLAQIVERIALLQLTSPRDRQQTSHGQLPFRTAIAETNFPPLHRRPLGALGSVVGRLHPLVLDENVASGFRHLLRFEKLSKFLVTRLVACD